MTNAGSPENPDGPIKAALDVFRRAWLSGKPLDLEPFLADHPECGPELRDEIEGFLLVAEGLPRIGRGLETTPSRRKDDGEETQGRSLGDFEIIREIGRGGMATVYEARQISLKRKVALKLLPSHLSYSREAVKKFQREAEAGGRPSHPGIVAIYTVGEHEGQHYIAQELIEGGITLADKLEEFRERNEHPRGYFRFVADFVQKVTEALHFAHESGVIHRDIKPSNILLTKDSPPKVTDFGLAKIEDALALSRTGDFSGTPYYMSPEQAASKRFGIDRRTDIFSLGITLYEMLTLSRPFEGDTSQEIFKKILLIDPIDPHKANPKVPRDLSTICLKAVEKLPDRRYQTMEEFGDDLNRFLQGDVISAKLAGPSTRIWKRVKRNPVVSSAISVAILAVLVLIGYVLLWSYPQIRHERDLAEAEKERALAAEKEADRQRKVAEDRYNQIIRLSDVLRLSDLETEAEALWPAYPENVPLLKEWIERAEKILDRSNEHRRTLASLRQDALPYGKKEGWKEEEESKRRTYTFEDTETQWQHNTLVTLVAGLDRLADEEKGLLKSVKERLDFAETVEERSIREHREAWDTAIMSISNKDECPKYKGLVIKRHIGLVPIGRDPDSGLWEFAHLQTGEIPERGHDGKLVRTEEMGLILVLIPGGTFNMGAVRPSEENPFGSPNVDPQAELDESPVHAVTLEPFFLSKYEMTQGQWLRFTGNNPSAFGPHNFKPRWSRKLRLIKMTLLHPVEMVSWEDCVDLLDKLGFRLPSEREWEYAARAGTTTVWWTGNDKESLKGAANLCDLFCKENGGNSRWDFEEWLDDGYMGHAPVGSYSPNAFGLHDVCGNNMEWCREPCGKYRQMSTDGNDHDSRDPSKRCIRGGCWFATAYNCRSAIRCQYDSVSRFDYLGLRPACSLRD